MRHIRIGLMSVMSAALLVACGGGNDVTVPGSGAPAGAPTAKGSFKSLVSFGDSLSDVGTYTPVTSATGNAQPPYIGGKFTTNIDGNKGTVWVENLATQLGLPVVKPAQVGFTGIPVVSCAVATVPACTGYAQGGARVTNPVGYPATSGFLAVPVVTQIANHLASAGSFKDSDLIFVWAGDNDLFTQADAFAAAAKVIQTNAATGKISVDEANKQLYDAQTTAQYAMKQAAQELAGYVRDQILAKGGKYVVVVTPVDIAATPDGQAQPAANRGVATTLVDTFNLWLRDGLTNQPVQWIDSTALLNGIIANPGSYGLVNLTTRACDLTKTHGSSLFCNATPGMPYNGLVTGADPNTWLFADGVHPTTGGHRAISNRFFDQLKAFGWI